jgi:hypothetical protein
MTEVTGDTNPFFKLKFPLPEGESANKPIDRNRLELIVCRSIILDLAREIKTLGEHPLYKTDQEYKYNIDQANKMLFQVKGLAGLEFRSETGASPLFQLIPSETTIYNANCLLACVDGYLWEANRIINQYNEKRIQIILGIVERILTK